MLPADGPRPGSEGARVRLAMTERSVIDGRFAATREWTDGLGIWQLPSLQ